MSRPADLLAEHLAGARRLAAHLERSHRQVAGLLPLAPAAVATLDEAAIDRIDLFLSRFGRLQDFLSTKLFRSLGRAALEGVERDLSVLDTLHRMEKFGVLDSAAAWGELRQLRNSFHHEYLQEPEEIAANVNTAFGRTALLLEAVERSARFAVERLGMERG